MKKLLLFISVLALGMTAQAVTKGQFAGMQMMINIASVNYDGTVDGSPQTLFDVMDRPIEGSIAGQAKKLMTPKGVFNFICAHRAENNYQCSIFIQNSTYGKFAPGYAVLDIQGDQARDLAAQFFLKNSEFVFRNEGNTLYLKVTPDRFYLVFKEGGV
jgi:hypothetical protein